MSHVCVDYRQLIRLLSHDSYGTWTARVALCLTEAKSEGISLYLQQQNFWYRANPQNNLKPSLWAKLDDLCGIIICLIDFEWIMFFYERK